nr:protein FAR1-RELATED SEQUENCE 5-like [Ipomoea batatas]
MITVDMVQPTEVIARPMATPATQPLPPPDMNADWAQPSGVDAMWDPPEKMGVTFETHKTWTPTVDTVLLPAVGQRFSTLEAGIQFYMEYGIAGGFDVRHSTLKRDREGAITMRFLVSICMFP